MKAQKKARAVVQMFRLYSTEEVRGVLLGVVRGVLLGVVRLYYWE